MTASPTLSLVVTVGAYLLGVFLSRRSRSPIFHPVVVGVVGVSLYLSLTRLPYAAYAGQTGMLSYLLGPAIVALALPLYEQSAALRRNLRPLVGASVFCVVLIAGLGFAIGCGLSLSPDFRLALMTRASSAIGMAIAGRRPRSHRQRHRHGAGDGGGRGGRIGGGRRDVPRRNRHRAPHPRLMGMAGAIAPLRFAGRNEVALTGDRPGVIVAASNCL
jgi:hypothetical protein